MSSTVSRRSFLGGAGSVGAAALLGGCSGGDGSAGTVAQPPASASSTVSTTGHLADTGGTLVLVTLYGGNDALNTVIPYNDPLYGELRGGLAIPNEGLHLLDDDFALNPELGRLAALWESEQLAIVHGVGFEGLDRSHFHCMDVWQAGTQDDLGSGWVGRWLDLEGVGPMDVLAVGPSSPLLIRGRTRSGAVIQPEAVSLPGDARLRKLAEMVTTDDVGRPPLATAVAASSRDLLEIVDTIAPILAATEGEDSEMTAASDPERSELHSQLQAVARLIKAELPTRVYCVGMDGFDTHSGQADAHPRLLSAVDAAVGEFLAAVGSEAVTVAVFSEFGRRVRPNNTGTDHGTGGTVLVAGTVKPGHHGDPPPLGRLDAGDLAWTTDFRSVFGGLVEGTLGLDASALFGDSHKPIAII